ncbi:pyruvate formate lyase family protein [candidate division CSSED10-310 bacterium]|uniref:Pyruvate formate lyase family protein n=1 Tax=candidate division CSSED10-310 bacterium TaxID=2855610 RepID=A0ABV6YYP8_UNCC1
MMSSATISTEKSQSWERITRLKAAVQNGKPGICPERAVLWTAYHQNPLNRRKPVVIQMAEALREVLVNKSISIYDDELIVGNFSSRRVGGSLFPELHGVPVMEDIFKFSKRETNALEISRADIWQLLKIVPFWALKFVSIRAYRSPLKKIRFLVNQLRNIFYLINESGGISHLAPDYAKLVSLGTDGIRQEVQGFQSQFPAQSPAWYFLEAVAIIAEGLALFGERYAILAGTMAAREPDPTRKSELETLAHICQRVPRKGARTFHEALQSLFFAQIAINLESLDNSVCPGRMDFYLFPYYHKDVTSGLLTREQATELIAAFSIKMSEIVPVFSERITRFHGGMFNGQVVTVGGTDSTGRDSTNELSYIFLEVMNRLRMRQPNYHARFHPDSPSDYVNTITRILVEGSNSPALYNDQVIVDTMCKQGYKIEDARNYTAVGCVEPVSQGKSFSSTDAAIFNVPIILELALNQGKRFGSFFRAGARTRPVSKMTTMADVEHAFEIQLKFQLYKLILDLQAVELANRKLHPTPLTSMLLEGCLESGTCSTAGGARYNFSGIQCVGPTDTGDALYAIEQAVFVTEKLTLKELVDHLKNNLQDEQLRNYLRGLPKFGNDEAEVDRWTIYVINEFRRIITEHTNTRGGNYVPGLYSVTSHEFFGQITGALPHGRRKGESFASGIAPGNGMDRNGPTALLNSINRIDFSNITNGANFNIKFDPYCLRGQTGLLALHSILKTYFRRGGMQIQVNVLDPSILLEARDNPDLYPHLLVRVSGYSAYFNDLSPEMKDEIIRRTVVRS